MNQLHNLKAYITDDLVSSYVNGFWLGATIACRWTDILRHEPLLYELVASLQPTRRAWMQAANCTFVDTGLPSALAMVVVVIGRLGGSVQHKSLAGELGVGANALVRTVDQGEALGLLARTHMAEDRRGKLIALTADGLALAARMEAALSDVRAQLLREVPREDIATATRVLRTLGDRAMLYVADMEATAAGP